MEKAEEKALFRMLHTQLQSLRSIVPVRPNSCGESSVIIDALEHIQELQQQIEQLSSKVEVIALETGLGIQISCPKRPGLTVSIIEALERSGLIFAKVDVRCSRLMEFDIFSTQSCGSQVIDAEAVRKMLLRIITEYRNADAGQTEKDHVKSQTLN